MFLLVSSLFSLLPSSEGVGCLDMMIRSRYARSWVRENKETYLKGEGEVGSVQHIIYDLYGSNLFDDCMEEKEEEEEGEEEGLSYKARLGLRKLAKAVSSNFPHLVTEAEERKVEEAEATGIIAVIDQELSAILSDVRASVFRKLKKKSLKEKEEAANKDVKNAKKRFYAELDELYAETVRGERKEAPQKFAKKVDLLSSELRRSGVDWSELLPVEVGKMLSSVLVLQDARIGLAPFVLPPGASSAEMSTQKRWMRSLKKTACRSGGLTFEDLNRLVLAGVSPYQAIQLDRLFKSQELDLSNEEFCSMRATKGLREILRAQAAVDRWGYELQSPADVDKRLKKDSISEVLSLVARNMKSSVVNKEEDPWDREINAKIGKEKAIDDLEYSIYAKMQFEQPRLGRLPKVEEVEGEGLSLPGSWSLLIDSEWSSPSPSLAEASPRRKDGSRSRAYSASTSASDVSPSKHSMLRHAEWYGDFRAAHQLQMGKGQGGDSESASSSSPSPVASKTNLRSEGNSESEKVEKLVGRLKEMQRQLGHPGISPEEFQRKATEAAILFIRIDDFLVKFPKKNVKNLKVDFLTSSSLLHAVESFLKSQRATMSNYAYWYARRWMEKSRATLDPSLVAGGLEREAVEVMGRYRMQGE